MLEKLTAIEAKEKEEEEERVRVEEEQKKKEVWEETQVRVAAAANKLDKKAESQKSGKERGGGKASPTVAHVPEGRQRTGNTFRTRALDARSNRSQQSINTGHSSECHRKRNSLPRPYGQRRHAGLHHLQERSRVHGIMGQAIQHPKPYTEHNIKEAVL